jgi:uncharacterized protein YbcI
MLMQQSELDDGHRGSVSNAISNMMVRLLTEYVGRGPTRARTRRLFQDAMRADIVAGIEEITGRRVMAFLSDNHISPDLAVETIILEPSDADGRTETGGSDLSLAQ